MGASRRTFLKSIPVLALSSHLDAMASDDALADMIASYRAGMAAYNDHPICRKVDFTDEEFDAAVNETYGPSLCGLQDWTGPAPTRRGAIEALRLIVDEGKSHDMPAMVLAMAVAALSYFEAENG